MNISRQKLLGYFELASAQSAVGLNIMLAKFLAAYFAIFPLIAMRFSIGFMGIVIMLYSSKSNLQRVYHSFMSLSLKDKVTLVFQAACGGFIFNILILYGMQRTTATAAGIITSLTPMMIFVFSVIFLREKITSNKVYGLIVAMIGLLILNLGKADEFDMGSLWGNFWVFMAVIPEAMFTILSKSVGKKIPQIEAVTLVNFFNVVLFLPFLLVPTGGQAFLPPTILAWSLLVLYGLSGGVFFFTLWYRGLTKIDASTAGIFTGVVPISTTLCACFFLKEQIHFSDILGMFFVITAIVISCYQKHSQTLPKNILGSTVD